MQKLLKELEKGSYLPAYIFYGEEFYNMREAVGKFTEFFTNGYTEDLNVERIDASKCEVNEVLNAIGTMGFFSSQKLVLVENASLWLGGGKKNSKTVETEEPEQTKVNLECLLEYLANPVENTCLIFLAEAGIHKNRKLVKAVVKVGRLVEFPLLQGGEVYEFIRREFQKRHTDYEKAVADYLILSVGNNLFLLTQEIDKLIDYCGGAPLVTFDQAKEIVSQNSLFTVFALIDAVASKDGGKSLLLLAEMIRQGESEQKILVLLARQFRLIYQTKCMRAAGYRNADIAKTLGQHPFVIEKAAKESNDFSLESLEKSLMILLDVDCKNKMGQLELNKGLQIGILEICAHK
ncbi:MAG: DNA polymerase III subunit delta [Peptococcaceae bacterium]|nr:DNA polymerase III subunit delta [Peptococcaceae bacterium]